ncbi:Ig-like domain-containing protein [Eubacterium oxidoreducens]|uniref:Ig-like domain (Group 2) n=1 Tax=Eubacterium oxidoreducens TaxID=1732 RepID=A0A1G6A1V1_EUBOX|nr:Ig-like domain-containing protein [Eubacterium oxidoreducens]SDB02365.1 Ig-like domain (group 2) [Eubacterium oxidoreducens]
MKKNKMMKLASMALTGIMALSLTFATSLVSLSADETNILSGIYTSLTANSDYQNLISSYEGYATIKTAYSESDGCIAITITPASGYEDEIDSGTAAFYLDDNSWIYTDVASDNDIWTYIIFGYIAEALADYYKMDSNLVTGYITAVDSTSEDTDNASGTYYTRVPNTETATPRLSLYAGEAWNEDTINEVLDAAYFNGTVISNLGITKLTNESISSLYNMGKYCVYMEGDKNTFTMTLAEYNGYDANGATSVVNLIKTLKPAGYKTFDYSSGTNKSKGVWSVSTPTGDAIPEALSDIGSGYTLVQVSFATPYFYNGSSVSLKAGGTEYLTVMNGTVKKWSSSNKKVAKVSNSGVVTGLKKGTAIITATLKSGTKITCKVNVKSSPTLKVNGKKYVKSKTYKIKKGKYLKVKITGKADSVKNVYKSSKTKIAKVKSRKNATTVKIIGLKKGKSVITIKVNGVTYKIKVKVS